MLNDLVAEKTKDGWQVSGPQPKDFTDALRI